MKKKITIIFIIIFIIQLDFSLLLKANSYLEQKSSNNTFFSKETTFKVDYFQDEDTMPYCLITPSTANEYESIPLVIYLHGDGEVNKSSSVLLDNKNGIPQIIQDWPLENFNAYILMPHLTGEWAYNKVWNNDVSMGHVKDLLDKIIDTYNIDTNNIVLAGGSRGGIGSIYIAANMPEYFSKLVVISGYYNSDYKTINIPTRGYVGASSDTAINFMNGDFATQFGKENVYVLSGYTHHTILHGTFKKDEDKNNRSDLIEWMFKDVTLKSSVESIELNKTIITIPTQQIMQLAVISEEILNGKIISWSSLDENIAAVTSNGLITAVNEGKTTVIAKIENQTAACEVIVSGILGDIDKDKNITAYDAYKSLETSVDYLIDNDLDEQIILVSDANKNGIPEAEDAYKILQYSVGLIDKF